MKIYRARRFKNFTSIGCCRSTSTSGDCRLFTKLFNWK